MGEGGEGFGGEAGVSRSPFKTKPRLGGVFCVLFEGCLIET